MDEQTLPAGVLEESFHQFGFEPVTNSFVMIGALNRFESLIQDHRTVAGLRSIIESQLFRTFQISYMN